MPVRDNDCDSRKVLVCNKGSFTMLININVSRKLEGCIDRPRRCYLRKLVWKYIMCVWVVFSFYHPYLSCFDHSFVIRQPLANSVNRKQQIWIRFMNIRFCFSSALFNFFKWRSALRWKQQDLSRYKYMPNNWYR